MPSYQELFGMWAEGTEVSDEEFAHARLQDELRAEERELREWAESCTDDPTYREHLYVRETAWRASVRAADSGRPS